MLKMSSFY